MSPIDRAEARPAIAGCSHDGNAPWARPVSSTTATAAAINGAAARLSRAGVCSESAISRPPANGASRPAQPHPVKTMPYAVGKTAAVTRSAVAAGTSADTAP